MPAQALIRFPGGHLRRLALLVIIPILGQACSSSSEPVVEPWKMGSQKKTEVLPYQKLRAKLGDWQLWEVANAAGAACIAIRAVDGTSQPRISTEDRTVTGDGGFYMFLVDRGNLPYFGFYGKYGYPRSVSAEAGGRSTANVDDRDTVLSWEGQKVSFRVVTQTYQGNYANPAGARLTIDLGNLVSSKNAGATGDQQEETVGTVDFAGVEEAYRAMENCRFRISGAR